MTQTCSQERKEGFCKLNPSALEGVVRSTVVGLLKSSLLGVESILPREGLARATYILKAAK
jgi:hypothetical protein